MDGVDLCKKLIRSQQPSLTTKMFLSGSPLRDIPWRDICSDSSEENQISLLKETVLHPACKRYPQNNERQRNFCKKLMQIVEDSGGTVSEDLYLHYVSVLSEDSSALCYKVYYLPGTSEFLPFHESKNLLSCGTTGLTTWNGAMALAEWCVHNCTTLESKRVIELGCGVGFSGTVALKTSKLSLYVFTDYSNHVLSLLNRNILLNFGDNSVDIKTENADLDSEFEKRDILYKSTNIASRKLDWTDETSVDEILQEFKLFDVILASDVVFDPELVPFLVHALKKFLVSGNFNNVAYFSLAVRNPDTYELFLKELAENLLIWEEVSLDFPQLFYYDRYCNIKLLKIVLKQHCQYSA